MAWWEAYKEYDTRPCHDLGADVLHLGVFNFFESYEKVLYEHVYSSFR